MQLSWPPGRLSAPRPAGRPLIHVRVAYEAGVQLPCWLPPEVRWTEHDLVVIAALVQDLSGVLHRCAGPPVPAPLALELRGFIGGLVVFAGEVLFWNRKVRSGRKTVGAQTLIGKEATVVSACRPSGQVQIAGEIWAARCSAGADRGETVIVVGRDGLTLLVEPARTEDAYSPPPGC